MNRRLLILFFVLAVLAYWASSALATLEEGDAAYKAQKYRDAIRNYEAVLKRDTDNSEVMNKLALSYEGEKWFGQSVIWWERYLKQFPNGPHADDAVKHAAANHRWIAVNSYNNLGEPPAKAETELLRAIELDPGLLEAYKWLARLYISEGRLKDAVDDLVRAQRVAPDDALIDWMIKDTKGRLEHGGDAYEKYQQGYVLYDSGDKTAALEQFHAAVTANPDFAAAHLWIARVLFEQGEYAQSIPEWEAVIRLEPDNRRAAWFLKQSKAKQSIQKK